MQKTAFALFVSLMAGACGMLPAQQQQSPSWVADPNSGCRVWDNYPEPDDRAEWSGPCVNGYAEGTGTLKWFSKGVNYEIDTGQFVAGKMQGHGTSDIFASGQLSQHFEGEFSQNRPNGLGTLTDKKSGQSDSGNWVNGCFNDGTRRAHFWQDAASCGM